MTEVSGKLMDSLKAVIFPELTAIRETQTIIMARLDVIDKRFENIEQRFENIEKRLDDLRFDFNQRFAELRSDTDKRLSDFRAEVDKRLADLRADMNARAEDLRADINARFGEGRADLNKRLDDFRADIIFRLEVSASRFSRTEDDLRYMRDSKVVETIQRHDELLVHLQRDLSETSNRIRAIEQKSLKRMSKKETEVKQSDG